jgi:hypothetical protein
MKPYRSEDQLINKLMEETFRESGSKEFSNDSSDLLSYFNTKTHKVKVNKQNAIEDSFKRKKVGYAKAQFRTSNQILRFEVNGEKLDIPKDWDLLGDLTIDSENRIFRSGTCNDSGNEMLFNVLSSFMGRPKELAFIKFHGDIYLVHTKKGEEQDLKWLDNFIIEEEEPKAA